MDSFARFQARSGLVVLAVYAGFVLWMIDGLALGQRSPLAILLVMVVAFAMGAVLFGGLWVAHMRSDGDRHLADEREAAIEAKSERLAAQINDTGLLLLVLLALSEAEWGWMGSFALTRMEGLVFALVSLSALSGLVRFVAGARAAMRS